MSATALRELYEDVILDHNRHPRNFRKHPKSTNREAHGYNPICGDDFTLYLVVNGDGVIKDVGFDGHGCAISTASASLMTEALLGKTEVEAEALFQRVHQMLMDQEGGENSALGKLRILQGVKEFPSRVKCATLAWHTLHAALTQNSGHVTTE